jgi:hypothetical protein
MDAAGCFQSQSMSFRLSDGVAALAALLLILTSCTRVLDLGLYPSARDGSGGMPGSDAGRGSGGAGGSGVATGGSGAATGGSGVAPGGGAAPPDAAVDGTAGQGGPPPIDAPREGPAANDAGGASVVDAGDGGLDARDSQEAGSDGAAPADGATSLDGTTPDGGGGPMVNFVAPYVALPNTSLEVVVRGSDFGAPRTLAIRFGESPASTFRVVSDTEIRVTHPPLPPGTYPVHVIDQFGLGRTRASLLVKEPAVFTYAALPTTLVRARTLYDPERIALYTNNWGLYFGAPGVPRIERYRLLPGGWVADSLLLNGPPRDIALTPDGRELIALTSSTLYHVDLVAWNTTYQIDVTAAFPTYPESLSKFSRVSMTNDGRAVLLLGSGSNSVYRYDVLAKTFTKVPDFGNALYGEITPATSLDGSRILLGQNGITGPLKLYVFDATTSQFAQALPDLTVNWMSYDRTGTKAVIDGYAYDRQFKTLGFAPDLVHGAVSPDGSRGYGYMYLDSGGTLATFDLDATNGDGTFKQVGPKISIPDKLGLYGSMTVSNDGKTVFFSGEEHVIVQPLP